MADGKNLTLKNGENDNLLNDAAFTWAGSYGGKMRLNLALSNLDLVNHTIKLTSTWYWHSTTSDSWCWDVNPSGDPYKLYAVGTSSSSGTSKTYNLYTGGNKHNYGSISDASGYFSWAAAYSRGSNTYGEITYNTTSTVHKEVTVNLASDNSLSMSIACKLVGSGSGYGPRSTFTWTAYTLTIDSSGAVWIKAGDTWKNGVPWVNVNGTWKAGTAWVNVSGTWKKM